MRWRGSESAHLRLRGSSLIARKRRRRSTSRRWGNCWANSSQIAGDHSANVLFNPSGKRYRPLGEICGTRNPGSRGYRGAPTRTPREVNGYCPQFLRGSVFEEIYKERVDGQEPVCAPAKLISDARTHHGRTDRTVVLLCPLTVTTIVVTPGGPTLVARPFPSTVAIDASVEDHLPCELLMV